MRGIRRTCRVVAMLALFVGGMQVSAGAAPISFTVEQLSDSQWRYTYFADAAGNSWIPFRGFAIDFDAEFYGAISGFTAPSGWDPIAIDPYRPDNPDVFGPAPGYFDALVIADPVLAAPFTVDFAWLGTGAPGSQTYRFYELDSQGTAVEFERGVTVPNSPHSVPEPGTLLLMGMGVLACGAFCRRHRRSPS